MSNNCLCNECTVNRWIEEKMEKTQCFNCKSTNLEENQEDNYRICNDCDSIESF